jgi:hypothetical protein
MTESVRRIGIVLGTAALLVPLLAGGASAGKSVESPYGSVGGGGDGGSGGSGGGGGSGGPSCILGIVCIGGGGGGPGGGTPVRIEAESFDSPDAGCNPDYDGEYTYAYTPSWTASGGQIAFAPHSGCGLTFNGVNLPSGFKFTKFHVAASGIPGEQIGITVQVWVDGTQVASGSSFHAFDGSQNDHTLSFTTSNAVSGGSHTVRVDYSVYQGCSCSNMHLDYVEGTS